MKYKSLQAVVIVFLIAFFSCSGASYEKSESNQSQSLQIDGYWFSEGNIHVESNWIKFDFEDHKFYEWSSEQEEPSNAVGQFSFEYGNVILNYYKSEDSKLLLIDQLDENTIRLSEKGPNNGVLTYNKIKASSLNTD
ncbi:MAG: hypothetical protein AAF363_22440 [Bacteroidota bacterium]